MPSPIRIVSTSDRYDFDWEHDAFAGLTNLSVSYQSGLAPTEDDLIRAGKGADALIIGARDAINRRVLEELPDLRVIGRLSVGLDNIDLPVATEFGVVVTHYPMYCTNEVADHAIALIYTLNRNLLGFDHHLRAGGWSHDLFDMQQLLKGGRIRALRTLTLGIIGFGRIGQQVARRMADSVATIQATDPYLEPEVFAANGVTPVDLETLLRTSDIVTIHCPLTPETRHLINAETLALMDRDAILVNTARGPIVDGDALAAALEAGRLASAGIDVFESEPFDVDSPIALCRNLIVTPHAAYYSEQSAETIRYETLRGVIDVLEGRAPKVIANPDVLQRLNLAPRD
jgi:D-3-phosphoglycerate dehydrogenase